MESDKLAGKLEESRELENLLGESIAGFLASGKTSLQELVGKGLTSLPANVGQLKSLTFLNLNLNLLTSLPVMIPICI